MPKGSYYHVESRKSPVVGARCAHTGRPGSWSGRHRPQCGAAHTCHCAARLGVGPAVVLLRVPLVLAAAMLPAGLLGDRYGRKKVLLLSLALFGAGSVACAYAPSAGAFIAARMVLGLAGAGMIVMALSALTVLFTEEERPRAVGIWGAANFLALPLGPILGGWLLTHYWWGWVFLLNVPVALVGLVAADSRSCQSRAPHCVPAWTRSGWSPRPSAWSA